jgi:hypothetical protein
MIFSLVIIVSLLESFAFFSSTPWLRSSRFNLETLGEGSLRQHDGTNRIKAKRIVAQFLGSISGYLAITNKYKI